MRRFGVTGAVLLMLGSASGTGRSAPQDAPDAGADPCIASFEQAQTLRSAGELQNARRELRRCAQTDCFEAVQSKCSEWLTEVERDIPSVVITIRDRLNRPVPSAEVTLDGRTVSGDEVEVEPGVHSVRVRAHGEVVDASTTVAQGQKREPVVVVVPYPALETPEPPPDRSKKRARLLTASYVMGGVALVGFGVFGALAGVGRGKEDDLRAAGCAPNCDIAALERLYIGADISLAIAVASGITGITLFSVGMSIDDGEQAAVERTGLRLGVGAAWLERTF